MRIRARAATQNRRVRKTKVDTSASADFTTTKVVPQMSVTPMRAISARPRLDFIASGGGALEEKRKAEKDPLQPEVAAIRAIPLAHCVGPAPLAARADAHRRNSHRQRNIGVRRRAIEP